LITSGTYAWSFLYGWTIKIIISEGGEGSVISFGWEKVDMKGWNTSIGSWLRARCSLNNDDWEVGWEEIASPHTT